MMEYKCYVAAVEFDDSIGRLHGRVVNSGTYPIATFEPTDVDGIRREFERSIDDYLASCREDDVEPKTPFSGTLNLPLGPDLHQRPTPRGQCTWHEPEQLDQAGGGGKASR